MEVPADAAATEVATEEADGNAGRQEYGSRKLYP